jgi:hypothetical protein
MSSLIRGRRTLPIGRHAAAMRLCEVPWGRHTSRAAGGYPRDEGMNDVAKSWQAWLLRSDDRLWLFLEPRIICSSRTSDAEVTIIYGNGEQWEVAAGVVSGLERSRISRIGARPLAVVPTFARQPPGLLQPHWSHGPCFSVGKALGGSAASRFFSLCAAQVPPARCALGGAR